MGVLGLCSVSFRVDSADSLYRLTWRLPLAGLVAFSHLQFSQIRGRQPYLIVRKILYVIKSHVCTRSPDPTQAGRRAAAQRKREPVELYLERRNCTRSLERP